MLKIMLCAIVLSACSATQTAAIKADLKCVGTEASAIAAILEGSGSTLAKLEALTPELVQCAKAQVVAAPMIGSGSAK